MIDVTHSRTQPNARPTVLPVRKRAQIVYQVLQERLETILPAAMRESGIDLWLILCQEDDLDPVFRTMIPMDTWCPILQMLVFYDHGPRRGVEGINVSGTNTHDLYDRSYTGQLEQEQWPLLLRIIEERDPKRIGINTGAVQWAAGGLTHNLYKQLVERLPERYLGRLESAEPLATRWLATLTDDEIELYDLETDLGETKDVAADQPDVTERLGAIMNKIRRAAPSTR